MRKRIRLMRVVIDSATREKLRDLDRVLEICDEDGRVLGYFTPLPQNQTPIPTPPTGNREETVLLPVEQVSRPLGDILTELFRQAR